MPTFYRLEGRRFYFANLVKTYNFVFPDDLFIILSLIYQIGRT